MVEEPSIVLASGSAARRHLLASAGVSFEVVPAHVDESALRDGYSKSDRSISAREIALRLAQAKAAEVMLRRPDAIVIGADQVLSLNTDKRRRSGLARNVISKAGTIGEARGILERLRGRRHTLHSAVVVAGGQGAAWEYVADAHLVMRDFSDDFLERYLAIEGDEVRASAGAYKIEGRGAQLFDRIEGDHSVILGLPLLPLLAELRRRGALPI